VTAPLDACVGLGVEDGGGTRAGVVHLI